MRYDGLTDFAWGWYSGATGIAHNTLNLNAAATFGAFSFVLKTAQTLTNIHIFLGKTGTINANEIQVDIYSDNGSGSPNASLSNAKNSGALANGWNDFTFNQALSAHTLYWVVIRNLNGTPASNFPTMRWSTNSGGLFNLGGSSWGWAKKNSTDSGATWAGTVNTDIIPSLRLDFSGSLYAGLPLESAALDTTNAVYSAREVGIYFTTPQYSRMNLTGIAMNINKSGTPTGNCRYKVYKGTTLVGTTQDIPNAMAILGAAYYPAYFTTPVTLEANTVYRVVLAESTQSDTSTNRFQLPFITVENNATSLALKPYGGTVKKTYFDGSSWTETTTDFTSVAFILNQDNMYSPLGTDYAYI